jgi:7-cyano-7-deazaguanine synthase
MSKSALLLSGGMDSIALAYGLRPDLCITVDYGQRSAKGEINAAAAVCDSLNLQHSILQIDCSILGSGDLSQREPLAIAPVSEWWPYRNQLLITFCAAVAVRESIHKIMLGTVATDNTHVDGRSDFFAAMNDVLRMQEGNVVIEVPAIDKSTVALCQDLQVPFEVLAWAHSCHCFPYACGQCRGCYKHRLSMRGLGYDDY